MIIKLTINDIKLISKLEAAFSEIFVQKKQVENRINNNPFTHFILYFDDNNVIGFINYDIIYERMEIIDIAVVKQFRNRKIATRLLEHAISVGKLNKIHMVSLEVKSDNISAINLYKKFNFVNVSIRAGYYDGVDAIIMERKMM